MEGLTFTTSTPTLAEDGGEINLTIASGLPEYAKTVDVYFTIEGLAAGSSLASSEDADTKFQVMEDVNVTDGVGGEMGIATGTNAKAAADVVITIKKIVVKTQDVTIEGATGTLEVTAGDKFGLPALTPALPTVASKVTGTVTISGAKSDGTANFGLVRTIENWSTVTTADAEDHYTADGSEPVKITVTYVITELKASAFTVGGNDTITFAATAIENGANTTKITLTVTKGGGAKWTQDKAVEVEVLSGADKITVYSEAMTDGDQTDAIVKIAAGALKNITGDPIVVTVKEVTPTT